MNSLNYRTRKSACGWLIVCAVCTPVVDCTELIEIRKGSRHGTAMDYAKLYSLRVALSTLTLRRFLGAGEPRRAFLKECRDTFTEIGLFRASDLAIVLESELRGEIV